MLKHEIKNILIQFFVEEEIFDSSATSQILVTQTDLQLRELEIKRQVEMEKLRLDREREKEEHEERLRHEKEEREDRIRLETLEREDRLLREKIEQEKIKLEMEKQREMERERLEHEKLKLEAEERIEIEKEKLQFELKMKELELEGKSKSKPLPLDSGKSFDVTKHIRLVPPFQKKEVDKYFLHFEKVAENLKWPREHWTLLLQSVVIGKAREIYTQLSLEQSSDYDKVKELILKAYELVPEAYRQKFRDCRKEPNQTHVEFARTKEQLFDRWCSSKKVGSDHC